MDQSTETVLGRLVAVCATPSELTDRVRSSLGEAYVSRALQLAVEMKGAQWLDTMTNPVQHEAAPWRTSRAAYAPENAIILCGILLALGLMLFPPHIFTFSQGIISDAGFGSLFDPPRSGQLRAVVNTPLLGILLTGTALVTAGATYIARSFGRGDA